MAILQVERLGGLAGMGAAKSKIRSRGEIDLSDLTAAELKVLDKLFEGGTKKGKGKTATADAFRYQLQRETEGVVETIVVPEAVVPAKVAACVQDELL